MIAEHWINRLNQANLSVDTTFDDRLSHKSHHSSEIRLILGVKVSDLVEFLILHGTVVQVKISRFYKDIEQWQTQI